MRLGNVRASTVASLALVINYSIFPHENLSPQQQNAQTIHCSQRLPLPTHYKLEGNYALHSME